jgi:hypothetical protein
VLGVGGVGCGVLVVLWVGCGVACVVFREYVLLCSSSGWGAVVVGIVCVCCFCLVIFFFLALFLWFWFWCLVDVVISVFLGVFSCWFVR